MAPRRMLVAGNWKMNGLRADGVALATDIAARAKAGAPDCELLVCPPATIVASVGAAIAGSPVALGGQNCAAEEKGAFTGDVSAEMLRDAGCSYVIIGHSERRHGCGEGDAAARAKVVAAWRAGLTAILCVGETRAEREEGRAAAVVAAAVVATGAVILFAPDDQIVYDNFGAAIGIPMTLLLPIMALLSVTSEWSQRSGLTTFTLVPNRGRVILAKLVVSVLADVAGAAGETRSSAERVLTASEAVEAAAAELSREVEGFLARVAA